MSRSVLIARIREPLRVEDYLEFFEYEGTIYNLLYTLIELDEELIEQHVIVRGFFIFPKNLEHEIINRYVLDDENLRRASSLATLDYYPGYSDTELNSLLRTTDYIVSRVKKYYRSLYEIHIAYQRSYVTLVYREEYGDFVQGKIELVRASPNLIEYELKIFGNIEKKDREKAATFENLIEFIRKLYKCQGMVIDRKRIYIC